MKSPLSPDRSGQASWLMGRVEAGAQRLTEKLGGPARRKAILLLGAVLALSSADTGAVGALAPQLETAFHIGNLDVGILVTVSSLVGALATLPIGVLADRTSRTRLLAVSILTWGVAEIASGLSVSYPMLLATRFALGAVTATAGPAVASLTGDLFPARERSRIYGYILAGELVGSGAGLLVSGDIGSALSWRAGFAILAVPSLAIAWCIRRYFPEPARGGQSRLEPGADRIVPAEEAGGSAAAEPAGDTHPERSDTTLFEQVEEQGVEPNPETVIREDGGEMTLVAAIRWVFKVRTNVLLIISSSLGYFFFAGLKTFAVIFARGQYGISQSEATSLGILVGAAAIAGILVAGRLADRMLQAGRIDARLTVGAAGYLAAAVLFIPPLLTHNLMLALPVVVLASASLSGPNSPTDAARLDIVPSWMWGRTEAIRTLCRNLLEAFAPLLFGFVSQEFGSPNAGFGSGIDNTAAHVTAASAHGLSYAFLVMLVPLAASGYILLRARRSYPSDVASAAESEGGEAQDGSEAG